MAAELHAVLDRLLAADLCGLSADEHATLLARVVRAEHRLSAGVLDAVGAFDTADVAATSPHRTCKRWLELRTRMAPGAASHLVPTARAVRDHLPATRDALAHARVSPPHVSAIVSVVGTVGTEHAVAAEPIGARPGPPVPTLGGARGRRPHPPASRPGRRGGSPARRLPETGPEAVAQRRPRLPVGHLRPGIHRAAAVGVDAAADHDRADDARSTPQLRADALLDLANHGLDTGLDTQLGGERPHVSVVIDEQALRTGIGTATVPWTGAFKVLVSVEARLAVGDLTEDDLTLPLKTVRHYAGMHSTLRNKYEEARQHLADAGNDLSGQRRAEIAALAKAYADALLRVGATV